MPSLPKVGIDNANRAGLSRRAFVAGAGAVALAAPATGLFTLLGNSAALGQSPNTLIVAVDQDASSLKPDTWGPVLNWLAVRSVYDTLCDFAVVEGEDGQMTYDPDNLVMRLAESMEMSEDKKTVTWTIRDGMLFGSGNPITAEAIAKSFKWYLDRNEVGGGQAKVDGLTDAASVSFEGNKVTMTLVDTVPWGASANYITLLAVVDADEIMSHATAADPFGVAWLERNATPSGPYKIDSWTAGQRMVLTYRPEWWGPKPSIERIIFTMIPDASVRFSLLKRGEVHLATGLEFKDLASLEGDPNVVVESWVSNGWDYLGLNWSLPEFQDKNVRKAIASALPIEDIIETVYYGFAVPAKTPFGQKVVGADPSTWPYAYDLAKAKEYLAASAYPTGFSTTLAVSNGDINTERTAQLIVEALSQIGVNVEIQKQTPAQYSDAQVAKALPMGMSGFLSFIPDAGYQTLWNFFPDSYANFFGYSNPAQEEIGRKMLYMDPNDPERAALLKQFQEMMAEDVSHVYTTSVKAVVAHSKKVTGFAYYPDYATVIRFDKLTMS
ncbi:MAG: peptide transporter substrate-binding protein, partial [Devosia sp.]|uniref:ABC transporter substrate-binding protein n=1 Tax=Devosia sp. TaxID=1871048 RepID=UPI002630CD94